MATFWDGKWEGNKYEVIPVEKFHWIYLPSLFSKNKIRRTFPYLVNNRIKFTVREISREKGFKPFSEIQIYEHYRAIGEKEYRTRPVKMDDKFSDDKSTITIDNELIFAWKGSVIYSIDKPESEKYVPLISVDLWSDDEITMSFVYIFMAAAIGAITSPLALILAGLLKLGK